MILELLADDLQISCDFLGGFEEKAYFCGRVKRLKEKIMALEIRSIPVLTGETAERFVREAEENERNPQRRKLVFSFEDIDRIMDRSRKYMKEHGGKGPFAK